MHSLLLTLRFPCFAEAAYNRLPDIQKGKMEQKDYDAIAAEARYRSLKEKNKDRAVSSLTLSQILHTFNRGTCERTLQCLLGFYFANLPFDN